MIGGKAYMTSKKASRATKIPTRAKMNLSAVLIKIFLIAFTFCFIIIIGGVIFANDAYDCTPVIILLLVGVNILLMCVIYRVLVRHTKFLERRYSTLIASGLLFSLWQTLLSDLSCVTSLHLISVQFSQARRSGRQRASL